MVDIAEHGQNETWQNAVPGTVFVMKMDHRGDFSKHEQVDSGRRFTITSEERRLNMEKAASEEQDVFRNGMLQPVRLIGDDEETRELASNPNSMSESDMTALLRGHHKTFEARLAQVNNVSALNRMLALAYTEDVSVNKVQRIQARIGELSEAGLSRPQEMDPSRGLQADRATFGRPVSPR